MAKLAEFLQKAEEIKPIAEINGMKIMSFEDQRNLAVAQNVDPDTDLGGLKFNPDGSLARTRGNVAVVNMDNFYANRYRKVKGKYYVVTDWLAIEGMRDGKIPYPHIEAHVIVKTENGIEREKTVIISDEDFLANYTHSLSHESMKLVMDAMLKDSDSVQTDDLEF